MALWGLYLLLTLVEMLALKFIGGMTVFDSVNRVHHHAQRGGSQPVMPASPTTILRPLS